MSETNYTINIESTPIYTIDIGTTGTRGKGATVTIGDTEVVASVQNPSVVNTGTSADAIFNFSIPKGSTWYNGIGKPASSLGDEGDYYINTTTNIYYNKTSSTIWTNIGAMSSYATWGAITGTLSDQTDLQDELDAKYDSTNFVAGTNYLAPDGNGSSLTDLNANEITSGTVGSTYLPTASDSTLGAVKVDGTTITITDGVISSAGGGVVDFNALGTVTTNITLAENVITTAYFSGSTTITLPTVTDTAKQVECVLDFTTASTGYPTITNKVALTGTIAVTNASATVTGTSTAFTTELNIGDTIILSGVEYYVSAIASNTFLTLTATYSGTTASGLTGYRKILKWSSVNSGKAPSVYSISTGIRNKLTFQTIWKNSLLYWEAEYKAYGGVETSWTQPTLSANGTVGSSDFAVYSNNINGSYQPYYSFDNNSSTTCSIYIGGYLLIYNSSPIKVSSILITNWSDSFAYGWTLYGSNDNSTYTTLASGTNSNTTSGGTWSMDISSGSRGYYKYYKIVVSSGSGSTYAFKEVDLTATYIST